MLKPLVQLRRYAGAQALRLLRVPARNRERLYFGSTGMRMLTFHATPPEHMDSFRRVVDWCSERFTMVGPEAVDALCAAKQAPPRDQMLVTFDDGIASNFEAARWLADQNIKAIFFVVPSFIDRTMDEYLRFHADQGVEAFRFDHDPASCGLSRSQVAEMIAMGHLIAAHNYAHRDLGGLRTRADLEYEITRAADAIEDWTGKRCDDFAWGFGCSRHISAEAADFVSARFPRVYSAVRGMNVNGLTPRFLLRDCVALTDAPSFITSSLEGSLDALWKKREWVDLERAGGLLSHVPDS